MSPQDWSDLRRVGDDQLRLMTKVARMYHEQGRHQSDIAQELHLSQARVSRLLRKAVDIGLVRTTVVSPEGTHTDLEAALEARFGLAEVVLVDASGMANPIPALGSAAASYLSVTLTGGDTIGISSWSETLLATVEQLRPFKVAVADRVIQVIGGTGNPVVQVSATRLTSRLADATGAAPVFLPTPVIVDDPKVRQTLLNDSAVRSVTEQWNDLSIVLMGIGSVAPSDLLRRSGNILGDKDMQELQAQNAVGDICMNFYDATGRTTTSSLSERTVSIPSEQLRKVDRRVGVAGGTRKYDAILGALRGSWLTVLITDLDTGRRLLEEPASS